MATKWNQGTPPKRDTTAPFRRINQPLEIDVRASPDGSPASVRIPERIKKLGRKSTGRGTWHQVEEVMDLWKLNDEWWRGPEYEIERMYYELMLENGRSVTIFHDLIRDRWYEQKG